MPNGETTPPSLTRSDVERSLELEILHILLEAGEENLPTILNALLVRHPDTAPEVLLVDVSDALQAIERQSFAQYARYEDGWVALTPEERQLVLPLVKSVVWQPAAGRWRWKKDVARPDFPVVILTDRGKEHIHHVLRAAPGSDLERRLLRLSRIR